MRYHTQTTNLYYEILGEGKPVVMLHGFACDHRLLAGCMEPVFENTPGYSRYYIDLPGMGKSTASTLPPSSDAILDVLVNFIKDTIAEPFLLVGQSYGGYLARGLQAKLHNMVDGVLLIAPVIHPDRKKRQVTPSALHIIDPMLAEHEAKDILNNNVFINPTTLGRYNREIGDGIKLADLAFVRALHKQYAFTCDINMTQPYEKPSLVITSRQDNSVGFKDQQALIDSYPRATFAILDLAGHNLQLDRADLFTALVRDWLDRLNYK